MSRAITKMKTGLLTATAALLFTADTNAATYTAILSGNFSSKTTWTGGLVPPKLISADDIIIPNGIKITMDQDMELSGSATLLVNGSLTGNTGNYMSLTTGSLSGAGSIDVDSVYTSFMSGFNFTGSMAANSWRNANAMITTGANLTVNNTLHLAGGTMDMASGSLTLSNNATIIVSGGVITTNGGSLNFTNGYNVLYNTQSATTGLELSGSGLTNITVDVPTSSSVMLSSDLDVSGNLNLNSGSLDLNSRNLTFTTTGNLSGTGTISSSSNSDIVINATAGLTGTINFSSGGNTVDDFTINLGSGTASTSIGGDLMISGQLSLQNGRINMQGNNLELMTNATVTGGSSNSFVITGTDGTLSLDVAANSSQTFHIGTNNNYTPSIITANSSSASSKFSIGVDGSVMQDGTTGVNLGNTQPLVNATWYIASSTTANVNVDIETRWSSSMEVNSFDRTKAYISHYTSGSWDATASANATTTTDGMFSIKRTGITSFSPFAVFDENTSTAINDVQANKNISIYPNPATNVINISLKDGSTATQANIYNTTGNMVSSNNINSNTATINIAALPAGMYYIRIANDNSYGVQKFVKQ